ncbi:threonine aldolase [Spirochaetia bacterium]|nr:threonine aldolase [Spirochaetia bacterium]
MIDIRSDTVTQPTPAMRSIITNAKVGDDVYDDDSTIKLLEKMSAEIVGKQAALFVPSGTFGNQLALFTWCPRGTEVILGEECHIVQHEAGAPSIIAGVQLRQIPEENGKLKAEEIKKRIRKRDLHAPATSLICLENAHSYGKAIPLKDMDKVFSLAKKYKLPVHLDGARIFNAAEALNTTAKEIADRASSVMFCLSKGLCAPVGSLLAGDREFIAEARMKRKIMGGGMRKVGFLGACGVMALTEMTKRVVEDNGNARMLEEGLSKIRGITVRKECDVNMVFFKCDNLNLRLKKASEITEEFRKNDIIINSCDKDGLFRFVTHYWIKEKDIEAIVYVANKIFGGL